MSLERVEDALDEIAQSSIERDLDFLQRRGATPQELDAHAEFAARNHAEARAKTLAEIWRFLSEPSAPSHRLH